MENASRNCIYFKRYLSYIVNDNCNKKFSCEINSGGFKKKGPSGERPEGPIFREIEAVVY